MNDEKLNISNQSYPSVSIITTIDFLYRSNQLFKRLKKLSEVAVNSGAVLVISHNERESSCDKKLHEWYKQQDKTKIILITSKYDIHQVNNALLRNVALHKISTPRAILMDVDIACSPNKINYMVKSQENEKPIVILPCFYLTQAGTKYILRGGAYSEIINDFFLYRRKYVLHLAMPSSFCIFNVKKAIEIGGFYEGYLGHGYEDLDFLIRMASHYKLLQLDEKITIDVPYRAPLLAEGFRAQLAKLCLDSLLEKQFVFHLFHKKNSTDPYYRQRINNKEKFLKRTSSLVSQNTDEVTEHRADLISTFFEICSKKKINSEDFFACFDARPRSLLRNSLLRNLKEQIARKSGRTI